MRTKGITREQSLQNLLSVLEEMHNFVQFGYSVKELCGLLRETCRAFSVRKMALADVLPFVSGVEVPTIEDAINLRDRLMQKKREQDMKRLAKQPKSAEQEDVPSGITFDGKMMSSLYIAQETGKSHNDVMKAIRKMEPAWEKTTQGKFSLSEYKDSTGRTLPCYSLTKTECLYIATKFNDEARAKLILRWEALETGKAAPMASAAMSELQALQVAVNNLVNHEQRLAALENRLKEEEQKKQAALENMYALPEATVTVAKQSTRSLVNEAIRQYSIRSGIPFNDAFRQLYTKFRYIYHHDISAMRRNRNCSGLDIAEANGWLEHLYALAMEMLNGLKSA